MKIHRHAAFTLVELMISIALALLLILGINEVFSLTSKAVGAGQALGSAYEADRGAQTIMAHDFANMAPTAPLLIVSQYQKAFRSAVDMSANQSTDPATYNPIGNQSITYYSTPWNLLSSRISRIDRISFCCRDLFQQQSGTVPGAFLTPSTSYEAYVWYGHLDIGDNTMYSANTGAWSVTNYPGAGMVTSTAGGPPPANPNNFFSSQWALGRVALLFQSSPIGAYNTGIEYGSKTSDSGGSTVQTSRYDTVSGPNEYSIDSFTSYIYTLNNWWGSTSSSAPIGLSYRFQAQPKPGRPLSPSGAAFSVPVFVPSCTQFCVEFAGDFASQNSDGSPNSAAPGPDGTIDFRYVAAPTPNNPKQTVRQIMWYGMTRNVVGDNGPAKAAWNSLRPDVDSVQNIWSQTGAIPSNQTQGPNQTTPQGYNFEHMYAGDTTTFNNPTYVAAWHPKDTNNPRPKLIRITWAVDDPNNRLGQPVYFEYVFPVP